MSGVAQYSLCLTDDSPDKGREGHKIPLITLIEIKQGPKGFVSRPVVQFQNISWNLELGLICQLVISCVKDMRNKLLCNELPVNVRSGCQHQKHEHAHPICRMMKFTVCPKYYCYLSPHCAQIEASAHVNPNANIYLMVKCKLYSDTLTNAPIVVISEPIKLNKDRR